MPDPLNQAPPLTNYNVFSGDRALNEALRAETLASNGELVQLGALAGSEEAQTWARLANTYPPVLHTHDRYGKRIDEVEYHPAYHELIGVATRFGLHGTPWANADASPHTARAAAFYVWGQLEAGHGCPISMTYAAVPALRANAALSQEWEPLFAARENGALCGMAMTEKQGGSDVRANITRGIFAETTPHGDAYLLSGHKWFCSAPMSDAFLVLAQTDEGLTCFFMPRVLAGGTRNRIFIQRLKDKLGNRSNASSEIELDAAWAIRIGEAGRGIQTIVEMVNFTRLDCINGSAALMRAAVAQAIHHAQHRSAFGKLLAEQPLMQNVLADLAIESEAAMLLLFRLARAVDRAHADPQEALLKRLGTALGKYYVCKRTPAVVAEALECLGGNGYVEDSGMPRLYRESPLNSIWEGSGNINALDVLRILARQPEALDALRAEIEPALADARVRAGAAEVFAMLADAGEADARMLAERLAQLWQAALFARSAGNPAAELFIDSRVARRHGATFGTLAPSADWRTLIGRASAMQSVEYTT